MNELVIWESIVERIFNGEIAKNLLAQSGGILKATGVELIRGIPFVGGALGVLTSAVLDEVGSSLNAAAKETLEINRMSSDLADAVGMLHDILDLNGALREMGFGDKVQINWDNFEIMLAYLWSETAVGQALTWGGAQARAAATAAGGVASGVAGLARRVTGIQAIELTPEEQEELSRAAEEKETIDKGRQDKIAADKKKTYAAKALQTRRRAEDKILKINGELEQRVSERTSELCRQRPRIHGANPPA